MAFSTASTKLYQIALDEHNMFLAYLSGRASNDEEFLDKVISYYNEFKGYDE